MTTKDLKQEVLFRCLPGDIFEILMDSKKHSKLIGDVAKIGREPGEKFSVWGDSITGVNIEVIPNNKIVQNWRMREWPEEYFSKVIFSLRKVKGGTKVIFRHVGIPTDDFKDIKQGWVDYYWKPMKLMVEG